MKILLLPLIITLSSIVACAQKITLTNVQFNEADHKNGEFSFNFTITNDTKDTIFIIKPFARFMGPTATTIFHDFIQLNELPYRFEIYKQDSCVSCHLKEDIQMAVEGKDKLINGRYIEIIYPLSSKKINARTVLPKDIFSKVSNDSYTIRLSYKINKKSITLFDDKLMQEIISRNEKVNKLNLDLNASLLNSRIPIEIKSPNPYTYILKSNTFCKKLTKITLEDSFPITINKL